VALRFSSILGVYVHTYYVTKKVVSVFVRFRAPLTTGDNLG
jgi:hypothetical protein